MTQKTLVLHIGDPKTGSTSIQRTLFERRWDCPTVSLDYPNVLSAKGLAKTIRTDATATRRDRVFAQTAKWIDQSKADVVVLSSEQFGSVPPANLKAVVQKFFPDCAAHTKVIAYARPHASRLLSSYAQRIKTGLSQKSLDELFEKPDTLSVIHLHKRFMAWRAEFGDQFILRPMVRSALRDGDVVSDFMGLALNDAPFTLRGDTEVNVSTSAEVLSGLRFIQRILDRNKVEGQERHAIGDRISNLIAATKGPAGIKMKLHTSLYEKIQAYCREDAENLDRDFFDPAIMLPSLIDAGKDTIDEAIVVEATTYYSPTEIRNLRRLTKAILALNTAHPEAWFKADRQEKGQGTEGGARKPPTAEALAAIMAIDGYLVEIAALLSAGQGRGAAGS